MRLFDHVCLIFFENLQPCALISGCLLISQSRVKPLSCGTSSSPYASYFRKLKKGPWADAGRFSSVWLGRINGVYRQLFVSQNDRCPRALIRDFHRNGLSQLTKVEIPYTVFPWKLFFFESKKCGNFHIASALWQFFSFINWIVAAETIEGGKLLKGGNYSKKYGKQM